MGHGCKDVIVLRFHFKKKPRLGFVKPDIILLLMEEGLRVNFLVLKVVRFQHLLRLERINCARLWRHETVDEFVKIFFRGNGFELSKSFTNGSPL
jgi:hypothetical protein